MYVHGATGRVTAGHSGVVCLSLDRWPATDSLLLPAAHRPLRHAAAHLLKVDALSQPLTLV